MSVEAERLRRMRECWRADAPSEFEIAASERRFRAHPRARYATALSWSVVGASAGVVAMLALSPMGRETSAASSHGSIIAEPTAPPPPAATFVPRIETPAPLETPPAKPVRVKTAARPRVGSATPEGASEPAASPMRDEAALREAPRWLAVGRGPDAGPVITGLEHEKKPTPGN